MKQTVGQIMSRISAIEYTLIAANEMHALLVADFVSRDGMPAAQLIVSDDGRTVPQEHVLDALAPIEQHINMLRTELEELRSLQVK
jgi:hypothetical protein